MKRFNLIIFEQSEMMWNCMKIITDLVMASNQNHEMKWRLVQKLDGLVGQYIHAPTHLWYYFIYFPWE